MRQLPKSGQNLTHDRSHGERSTARSLGALCIAIALLVLSGCATTISSEQAANIDRIGVIALPGNDFRVYDYGLTVFEKRDRKRIQKPDWALEQMVQDAYKAAIEEGSGYTFVATNVDRDRLVGAYGAQSGEIWERLDDGNEYANFSRISDELQRLGRENGVDTWVIVAPMRTTSPIWQRELYVVGTGTIREVTLGGRKAAVFSNAAVEVVAAETGSVIGATTNQGFEQIDTGTWTTASESSSAANAQGLLEPLRSVLRDQARITLENVGLIQ